MRKANCAVILATQSLSDAKASGILDVLTESCPTKIFRPNIAARQESQRELYTGMGLNETQLNIIAGSAPKRDYYLVSPQARRVTYYVPTWVFPAPRGGVIHITYHTGWALALLGG
jgi:type IV secretion system protein VirB4